MHVRDHPLLSGLLINTHSLTTLILAQSAVLLIYNTQVTTETISSATARWYNTTPHLSTFNNPPWPPLSRSSQREKTANKCGTTRMLTTMRQTHTWRSWENPLWSAGRLHTCTLLQQLLHLKVICYFNTSVTAVTVSQSRFVASRFRWKWLYYSPIYLMSTIPVKTFKMRHVLNNTVKLSILLWRRDSDS